MLVWICRLLLPLGVWKGLRFVIVALPGLFSYLLLIYCFNTCYRSSKLQLLSNIVADNILGFIILTDNKKGKRKVHGVPQSQTAALHRYQGEEETDNTKQAQIEQTYETH